MLQDIRQALLSLAKRPSSAVLTVVVFALAIGANTTVFSVFNGFFLRPLPFPDDDRLVMIYDSLPRLGVDNGGTSIPGYLDWRFGAPALEEAAIFAETSRTLHSDDPPEQVTVTRASPSLLTVLGVAPVIGRGFSEDEAVPGNERVILLSHRLWSTRFGARADILGQDLRLDDDAYFVVGVMPAGFGFPNQDVDAWIPFAYTSAQAGDDRRFQGIFSSVGRLRPGATLSGLNDELNAIARNNVARLPQLAQFAEETGYTVRAQPLRDYVVGDLEQRLLVLQGLVLVVLLIAGANVANLQLSRLTVRRKELAVRAALGASRRRLASLIVIESVLLALAGAGAGLMFAYGGIAVVRALGLERASDGYVLQIDVYALVVTSTAALFTALLSASASLLVLLREDSGQAMRDSGRANSGGKPTRRWRTGLVVVQIAVGVALLTGAGVLTKTYYDLQRQGPGFDAAGVFSAAIVLPETRYGDDASREQFVELALAALRSIPGVVSAGFTTSLPFSGSNEGATIVIDGDSPVTAGMPPAAQLRSIDDGYFATLGIPVLDGRSFSPTEPERVAMVDESFARTHWPAGGAIGERLRHGADAPDEWYRIIGVVPHVRHESFVQDDFEDTVYWHYAQRPASAGMFVIRTALPTESLTRSARSAIARLDPGLALYDTMPMALRVSRALGPQRASMVLTLAFAALAVVLAMVGVYGLLAWSVALRVGEIGLRMALGAQTADVLGMIMKQGGRMIVIGLIFGTAGALALGRVLSSMIPEIGTADPSISAGAALALAAAALTASWFPARRAARVDPLEALRLG